MQNENFKLLDRFENIVFSGRVVLFMKGSFSFPICGLSGAVCLMLRKSNIEFKGIDLLQDPEMCVFLRENNISTSSPYLYLDGKLIGGYDEILSLFKAGKLENIHY